MIHNSAGNSGEIASPAADKGYDWMSYAKKV